MNPAASAKVFGKPSRGHYVLVLTLNRHSSPSQITEDAKQLTRSHFFIVDLPGFERVKKSGVSGTYLEEAKHINHSLFVFAQCLQSERGRRPYRDSVLTLVLHPMFSKSYTEHVNEINVLAIVSGKNEDVEETISTLTFSQNSMNLRATSQTTHAQAKDEVAYLRNLVEERERQITDKDAKLLLQSAENEELKQQIATLTATVDKMKEKNTRLRSNLSEMGKTVRKSEDERDELTRTQRISLEKRLRDEADRLERQKEMEMTEFRIKTATEVSQAFASKVQRMTAEHEMTVAKLMEALMEKQKQEEKLISLVHKEQEEVRRLKAELGEMRVRRGRESSPAAVQESPLPYSESSLHSIIQPLNLSHKDTSIIRNAVVQTSEEDERSEMSIPMQAKDLEGSMDRSSSLPSVSIDEKSPSRISHSSPVASSHPSLLPISRISFLQALLFSLEKTQARVSVTKLDRKGKTKVREVWTEGVEAFVKSTQEEAMWTQTLGTVGIWWSTTSRLKRKSKRHFKISEIEECGLGQGSPGFERNGSLQDKSHLSLWAKYRSNCYFEVIFPDKMTLALWGAGLRLARIAVNTPHPSLEAWKAEYTLLTTECGLKSGH